MYRDPYGLELSCTSSAAADAYTAGLHAAMSLDRSGIDELESAVDRDPEFALAHCLLARQLMIYGLRGRVAAQIERAKRCAEKCAGQERSALRVGIAALTHDGRALDLALEHVAAFPRDTFVLMQILGPFGLLAFSGRDNWRQRNVELIEAVAGRFADDDWWFAASAGFSYAEVGELDKAERHAERAWRQRPNGATGHALAHVHVEQGAVLSGIRFLEEWQEANARSSDMRHHMRWHGALLKLESEGPESVFEDFRRWLGQEAQGTPPLDVLADNASLLWRLKLRGVEAPAELWDGLAEFADVHFPEPGFVFADLHCALVDASRPAKDGSLAGRQRHDALPAFSRAFGAFVDGRYGDAACELASGMDSALHVGGSNPQRAIVRETYDEASRRALAAD